jgi:hypothetical protein
MGTSDPVNWQYADAFGQKWAPHAKTSGLGAWQPPPSSMSTPAALAEQSLG